MGDARPGGDSWADDVRRRSRMQWSRDPAGGHVVADVEPGTPEAFAQIERHRDHEQPWMDETFSWQRLAGLRVLEVGVGLGTDHVKMARAGARLTGIDLTADCARLTALRLQQEGFEPDVRMMDAERLEFEDACFDLVYSFGVLHHVPHPERAFAEIRRVLRPGGEFTGGLYNRRSMWWSIQRARRVVSGEWRHESLDQRRARIERSTADHVAHVRLFSARELRNLLAEAGFTRVEIRRRHLGFAGRARRAPRALRDAASSTAGWYLVPRAYA